MTTEASAPTPAQVEGSGQLLELIRLGTASTVTQLATALGVSRSTVVQRLAHLERWGLVGEDMRVVGARGRPAAAVGFRADGGSVLAAHVGVTGYRAMVADLTGEPIADRFVEHDLARGPSALVGSLERTFSRLAPKSVGGLAGVGIGIPDPLELPRIRGDEQWELEGIRAELESRLGVATILDRDVDLMALAEQRNSWADAEVLVCLKLGTTIDASVVVRGGPVRGRHRLAGQLGHLRVPGQDAACTCGSRGCLEAVASGGALVRRMRSAGLEVEHVRDLVRLASEGDAEALGALREAGLRIGAALAAVVTLLDPDAITAWGYLTESEALFAGLREALHAGALPASADGLAVQRTALGPLAGARGAALRVLDDVFAPDAIDRALVAGTWAAAV